MEKQFFIKRIPLEFDDNNSVIVGYDIDEIEAEIPDGSYKRDKPEIIYTENFIIVIFQIETPTSETAFTPIVGNSVNPNDKYY